MKILLIEPVKDLTNILEKLLEVNGHHVISTNDCRTGLSLIYSQDYDVILTNIEICDCDRYCIIDILEEAGKMGKSKVIVLSESLNDEDRKVLKDRGVDACFRKPVPYEVIQGAINTFRPYEKIIK